MKRNLVCLTAISICLVACGKESDFKKAINTQLSIHSYKCLDINNSDINSYSANADDAAKLKEKTKNSYVGITYRTRNGKTESDTGYGGEKNVARLNALVSAGLLTKSSESLITYGFYDKKPDGYYSYDVYSLTDAGKSYRMQLKAVEMPISSFNDYRDFCYAHKEVKSIENFEERDYMGQKMAQVKYSYQYIDIADWINKPGIQEAFPEIKKTLDEPKEAKMVLIKTNNGWEYGQ